MEGVLLLFCTVLAGVQPFNLDLLHPVVYQSNQPSDFFGFSLALHPGGVSKDVPWYETVHPHFLAFNIKHALLIKSKFFVCFVDT